MILKHRIYFFFWKILMNLMGIKKGVFVEEWSDSKNRFITGVICGYAGESVNEKTFGFDIHIKWLQPMQGNEYPHHTEGWYSYKEFDKKIKFKDGSSTRF